MTHLQNLYEFSKRRGYVMKSFTCDPEFQTKAVVQFCRDAQPMIKLCVAITDEHFAIGEIERWHLNTHESMLKASVSNPYLTNPMWPLLYEADLDMYNSLPTARHPHKSPYQLFDKIVIDLKDSPTLPIGTIVVAHIPLNKQSLRVPGRGIPTVVVGRSPMGFGGVKLYNPATNKCTVRRTLKFVGDHPAQGLLFGKPLVLDVSDEIVQDADGIDDLVDFVVPTEGYLPTIIEESFISSTIPNLIIGDDDDILMMMILMMT